nr:electron transfer flavoprotein beta subunit/FixA family protein [Actinomycetales bacterium]
MTVVVAYKWAANPQDASVGADGAVDWSRARAALSEYDPIAAQVARNLADTNGTEVVGVSVGTSALSGSMPSKSAMSRGMDRGLVVADDSVADWNLTQVAAALAKLVERVGDADIVFTGEGSIDENAKMVPALLAGFLGWPAFFDVAAVEREGAGWRITQNIPGGSRTIEVDGPVVAAVATDAAQPKIPGMKDILAAGKKPVESVPAAELGIAETSAEVTGRSRPPHRERAQQRYEGGGAATELAAALKSAGLV